jgi:hypothetical protein
MSDPRISRDWDGLGELKRCGQSRYSPRPRCPATGPSCLTCGSRASAANGLEPVWHADNQGWTAGWLPGSPGRRWPTRAGSRPTTTMRTSRRSFTRGRTETTTAGATPRSLAESRTVAEIVNRRRNRVPEGALLLRAQRPPLPAGQRQPLERRHASCWASCSRRERPGTPRCPRKPCPARRPPQPGPAGPAPPAGCSQCPGPVRPRCGCAGGDVLG